MVGINFHNYMDRWIAAAAAPLIQKECNRSDALVGLLAPGFLLLSAVADALLNTTPTMLILAAIIAATGHRSVKPDREGMEDEWAARAPVGDG
jgi:hypothetical protein